MTRRRIGIVVQRYGPEIIGGAEDIAREFAERLAVDHDVEVLTTCATDYQTWENALSPGVSEVRGVRVRRFTVAGTRHPRFDRWWDIWNRRSRTPDDEQRWLDEQGPVAPELLGWLADHPDSHDIVIFFTYLYWPTVRGIAVAGPRVMLVPFANPGDPALSFDVIRGAFDRADHLVWCTDEERDWVRDHLGLPDAPESVVGAGFDPIVTSDGSGFAARHQIDEPYVLFLGRIGAAKGCDRLVEDHLAARDLGCRVSLVLAGSLEMSLPDEPSIRFVGPIRDTEKAAGLCGAAAVVVPGRFDCLSMAACEAWAAGRPVVANVDNHVVARLIARSGGGLTAGGSLEYATKMAWLLDNPDRATALGREGQQFVTENFSWHVVMTRLQQAIEDCATSPPRR